jgi:hypothetical protein
MKFGYSTGAVAQGGKTSMAELKIPGGRSIQEQERNDPAVGWSSSSNHVDQLAGH